MKVRIDFLKNSKSARYIISMHPDMAEFRRFKTGNYGGNPRINRLYATLYKDLMSRGTTESIEGCKVIALANNSMEQIWNTEYQEYRHKILAANKCRTICDKKDICHGQCPLFKDIT